VKKVIIFLFLAFGVIHGIAQKSLSIKGEILDSGTGDRIPFATIQLKSESFGTVSNGDGLFSFQIPQKYIKSTVVISSMGYESVELSCEELIEEKYSKIKLSPKTYVLSDIIVKPINPLDIIKNAIQRIADNYSTKNIQLSTFVREMVNENDRFVRLAEAYSLINYAPYNQKINRLECEKDYYFDKVPNNFSGKGIANWYDSYVSYNDYAKIIEIRTSKDQSKLLNKYNIVGGPLNILSADKVKYRNDFMDSHYFKFYKYELEDITSYKGKEVYVISFKPKNDRKDNNPGFKKNVYKRKFKKAPFKGKIYIEIESLAFVGFNYGLAEDYIYKNYYQHKNYDVRVDYKEVDGKWYIHQIKRVDKHVEITPLPNKQELIDTVTAYSQILVNHVLTEGFKSFGKDEIFPNSINSALFEFPSNYNDAFWETYNTIIPTALEQKIISDLSENESLTNQFKTSQIRDTLMIPPLAKKIPKYDTLPFEVICDDYSWMKDFKSKDVIQYLVSENKYADNFMKPTRNLQDMLTREMIKNTINTKQNYKKVEDYYYYERNDENTEYQLLCRKKGSVAANEEILIDFNNQAANYSYFAADEYSISPNNSTILYLIDKKGNEQYTGYFYDIKNNCKIIDSLQNIFYFEWIDAKTIIYSLDNNSGISKNIYYHTIGSQQQFDKLIYKALNDERIFIEADRDRKNILIYKMKVAENEILLVNVNDIFDNNKFKVISPFKKDHFYEVKIEENQLFILSNKNIANNQIFIADLAKPDENNWKTLFQNYENEIINGFYVCGNKLIIKSSENGNERIILFDYKTKRSKIIEFDEPCEIKIGEINYEDQSFEFEYSSFSIPNQNYTCNLQSFKYIKTDKHNDEIEFRSDDYKVERIWINSLDGTKIPVTIFYKKKIGNHPIKLNPKGNNYLLLTAYGNSGINFSVAYDPAVISLVNRGFIYAIAHVRGGSELGENWHLGGMKLNKKNTYTDFIDCAKFLIDQGYTSSDKLIISGGSAGGTLIAYSININPELFKAAIMGVPSLNVIESALDSTYRLQSNVLREHGNPYFLDEYNYMKSYSPYQNIKKMTYPTLLVMSGYVDERVKFWQSAMFIAKLREFNISKNPVVLKTEFNSGHAGPSGKNGRLKDEAYKYAFILDILNMK